MSAGSAETPSTTNPTAAPETHRFQAEVSQLLKLVINSLYSHKEIFLRELISNASDALDKLKFRAITEPELVRDAPALEIRLVPDKAAGTLTIEDTGVGMTREELAENLGTIAHSGSRAFLEKVAAQGAQKDLNLIGQFGVGFYSAYLVADRVEVISRSASGGPAHRWTSDAKDTFTIEPAERTERGTAVVLHLKPDQTEFLDGWRLRELVARYSDYVAFPIKLRGESEPKKSEGDTATEPAFETVNRAAALWQRPRNEVTDEQYNEFYQHLTHDTEAPLARTHFKVEGSQQFVGLLFVPSHVPFDLNFQSGGIRRGVRLFVKRVFIMDNCEELVPPWLRFVRGVIDSDDLPLNVSREILQDSAVVRAIRKQVTKKTLDLLEEMARGRAEDYAKFWRAFGTVVKEGLAGEFEHRDKLGGLVRFESSREAGKLVALSEYVGRMPAGQPAIYYITGESVKQVENSPHLEALRQRGYEVLYLTDPIDEFAVEGLREFQGKKLVSAMRADLELDDAAASKDGEAAGKAAREVRAAALKPLLDKMQAVLGEHVREVRLSDRLTDSPCCLVVPEGGPNAYLERLLRESGRTMPKSKRILEVNPGHALVDHLRAQLEKGGEGSEQRVTEWIEMLHDQALLTEGSRIEDPNRFARRMTALLEQVARASS